MLARRNTLMHPSGERIETPLLIPSFSSKGLGTSAAGLSEISDVMKVAEQFLTDSMLVSAYDIHHGHIPFPKSALTAIMYVDSGGYETSDLQDLSATYIHEVNPKAWDEDKLHGVLDDWPTFAPAVFVTYDRASEPRSLGDQIDAARKLIARYPKQLVTFLVKPTTKDQRFVQIDELMANVSNLAGMPIIGVTEKELAGSYIERMRRIALLRFALDDNGMKAVPIHIFGSLDPMSICLYYVAGAEIFDGLTWIRYGYLDGSAMYLHNVAVRRQLIHRTDGFARAAALQTNLDMLAQLTIQMRKLDMDRDFKHLDPTDTWLRDAYNQLRTKVGRL
jgi:queuine/archaeosine tRNA-ribosyltransferase